MVASVAKAGEVDAWKSKSDVPTTKACLIEQFVAHRPGDVPMTADVGPKVMLSWPSIYAIFFIKPAEGGGTVISHNTTPFASMMFKRLDLAACGVVLLPKGEHSIQH